MHESEWVILTEAIGSKVWIFPDGELPPPGDFPAKGHESIIILNTSDEPAVCKLTIYYTDCEPVENIEVVVEPRRVRCIRTNNPDDMQGYVVPMEMQYAMKWECSVPVVMQYGRLDTRDQPMHFYINQGFAK